MKIDGRGFRVMVSGCTWVRMLCEYPIVSFVALRARAVCSLHSKSLVPRPCPRDPAETAIFST